MKLYDRVKKMKNKMTLKTESHVTEIKGGNPEDHFLDDEEGQNHVFAQTHKGAITVQGASPEAQRSGDYEKAIKKIDKKAKPSFTEVGMVAAQAGVEGEKYNKENPPNGDMKVQKPKHKLAKNDMPPPPPPPPPSGPSLDSGKVNAFTAGFLGKSGKLCAMRKCYANLKNSEKLEKGDLQKGDEEVKAMLEAMRKPKVKKPGSTDDKIKAALARQKGTNPYAEAGPGGSDEGSESDTPTMSGPKGRIADYSDTYMHPVRPKPEAKQSNTFAKAPGKPAKETSEIHPKDFGDLRIGNDSISVAMKNGKRKGMLYSYESIKGTPHYTSKNHRDLADGNDQKDHEEIWNKVVAPKIKESKPESQYINTEGRDRLKLVKSKELADEDSHMASSDLDAIAHHLEEIRKVLNPNQDLPDWVDAKLTLAADQLETVTHYLISNKQSSAEALQKEEMQKSRKSLNYAIKTWKSKK